MLRPKRYPLVVRLALIESKLSHAAKLIRLLMDDMNAARESLTVEQDRAAIILSVTGALAMASGAEGQSVGEWIIALTRDFDREEADELGTDIIEQIMLNNADPEGEA